jgi:hypothetical protein
MQFLSLTFHNTSSNWVGFGISESGSGISTSKHRNVIPHIDSLFDSRNEGDDGMESFDSGEMEGWNNCERVQIKISKNMNVIDLLFLPKTREQLAPFLALSGGGWS